MEGNHIIVEPGTNGFCSGTVEITNPNAPTKPECPPTVTPNPGPDDTDNGGIFCGCPPPRPPQHCPPVDVPPTCPPPRPEIGNNPCCEDDPRFIMKRLILLEREVKKLNGIITDILGEDERSLNERLDNFATNICNSSKIIKGDIEELDRRLTANDELTDEINKLPAMQADIDALETCCETSKEFIDNTTQKFTETYEKMAEVSNDLKDDISDIDLRVGNAEEAIVGVDGFDQKVLMLKQELENQVSTLETKISVNESALTFKIDEINMQISDLGAIRNNGVYLKNWSKQIDTWTKDANEKFQKITQDIATLTKEVEKLQ